MRKHSPSEAQFNHYSSPETLRLHPPKQKSLKTKTSTLEELYREVHARNSRHPHHLFVHKNAEEIESLMRQNRTLIDSRHHRK